MDVLCVHIVETTFLRGVGFVECGVIVYVLSCGVLCVLCCTYAHA